MSIESDQRIRALEQRIGILDNPIPEVPQSSAAKMRSDLTALVDIVAKLERRVAFLEKNQASQ